MKSDLLPVSSCNLSVSVSDMFSDTSLSLFTLDLNTFHTSNVTDMSCMFFECESLTGLALRNFHTSNVTSMQWMFGYCQNLESLNIKSFRTQSTDDMGYMFYGMRFITKS